MSKIITIVALLYCSLFTKKAQSPFEQMNPGDTPVMFFPNQVSRSQLQWNNAFDRYGNIYYTIQGKQRSYLVTQEYKNGHYETPKVLPIDSTAIHSDIWVNSEGNHILYMSTMNENDGSLEGFNIWEARKNGSQWTTKPFAKGSSGPGNEGYPWLTESGNLYFSVARDGSRNSDVYVLAKGDTEAQKLPSNINSDKFEGDSFVAANEEFLIFAGFDREESMGLSDLYISFNTENGWTEARWLGAQINSEGYDGSPFVTPDGRYLIFTSSRNSPEDKVHFNHYIVAFDADSYR